MNLELNEIDTKIGKIKYNRNKFATETIGFSLVGIGISITGSKVPYSLPILIVLSSLSFVSYIFTIISMTKTIDYQDKLKKLKREKQVKEVMHSNKK